MAKESPLFFSKIRDWITKGVEIEHTQSTANAYKDALSIFRRYVSDERAIPLRKFTFDDCTYDFVRDYRNWLLDVKGYAHTTVNQRLAALNSYIAYAATKDVSLLQIQFQVADVPYLREPKKVMPIIENEDAIRALLSAPKNTHLGRRDAAILTILFDTCIRVSELIEIRLTDVVMKTATPHILIHGKGRKERLTPLSDNAIPIVESYIREFHTEAEIDCEYLFYAVTHGVAHKQGRRNIERIVQKYGEIAREDFPDLLERVTPHSLRRTHASLMYRDGAPAEAVASILGHESIQTTMDHYAFPSVAQKKQAIEKGTPGTIPGLMQETDWPDDNEEFARLCGLR